MDDENYRLLRERLVDEQLARDGITDLRVLDAMRRVPRHRFVPPDQAGHAYENHPLDLASGQTISQPLIVALMLQAAKLTGNENVLEVGTGSGYHTALLAELCLRVTSVERLPELASSARETLSALGYTAVDVVLGDGSLGCPHAAPYDRILVAAAAPEVPAPLLHQLAPNGILVIPVGSRREQNLLILSKDAGGRVSLRNDGRCVFVPLIGDEGWKVPVLK